MATLKDIIDELLKQKINIDDDSQSNQHNSGNNNDNNKNKKLNNNDIYNKLSTYLPEISINNLNSFLSETYDQFSKLNHKVTYNNNNNNSNSDNSDENNNNNSNNSNNNSNFEFYNLNNQFFDTINENSLKYNSIIRKEQEQQQLPSNSTNTTSDIKVDNNIKELSKCYSGIYYLFYVNLFRILLKLKRPQDFQDLLNEYYLEDLDTDSENEENDYLEQIKEKEKQFEKIKEINNLDESLNGIQQQQKENDKDDIYEPFENNNNNCDDDFIFYGKENKIENWDIVSKKLQSIIEPISYDHISDDSVWEDYSILEDIQDISKLLISNTQLKLQELLPKFIYILRDRMIHRPSDIQYILPLVFKILDISNPNEVDENENGEEIKKYLTPFQFKTILSLLSSLVLIDSATNTSIVTHNTNNHKNIPQSSIKCLSKYIYQLLPYLVDRIAFWNSIPNDQFIQINSSKLEFESISNLIYFYSENPLKNIDSGNWATTIIHKGILSQYIATITYKLMVSINSGGGVDILLDRLCKLACKSNLLSQFIQKVPEFMNLVLSNQDFIQSFPHYHLIWLFIFKCCYQLEIKMTSDEPQTSRIKKINMDEGIIAQDIDDNIKSFVERIENKYQPTTLNENENQKLEQLDVILNILLEAKTKISNKQLSERLFDNQTIQSLISKYERQIVLIKINQHKEQQQQQQIKKTKAQKKSFELFNYYLNQLRNKLKSLSTSNKKK